MLRFIYQDKMLHLNNKGVDIFISKSTSKNLSPHWDNYDLVIWRKDATGFSNIKGMFKENAWGIAERISVNNNGIWVLPNKYVKYFK